MYFCSPLKECRQLLCSGLFRDCVHTLHSRDTWLKQARVVRIGEVPYKVRELGIMSVQCDCALWINSHCFYTFCTDKICTADSVTRAVRGVGGGREMEFFPSSAAGSCPAAVDPSASRAPALPRTPLCGVHTLRDHPCLEASCLAELHSFDSVQSLPGPFFELEDLAPICSQHA